MRHDGKGKLITARNGTVIGYDTTGLTLRLSDRVIADIARRLPSAQPGETSGVTALVLGDIDAWNVERRGDCFCFDAKLPAYPTTRRFRRPVHAPGIVAEPPGRLLALLSIGGSRRCDHLPTDFVHPNHVVTADDDIGAVGMGGIGEAPSTMWPVPVRHATLDAATADHLIARRVAAGRALPAIFVRSETDSSACVADLSRGAAMRNLAAAVRNVVATADNMGVKAEIPVVSVDFDEDDVVSNAEEYVVQMRALFDRISDLFRGEGLRPPVFLMRATETGRRVEEHWQLSVFPAGHDIVFSGPGAAFDWDAANRPTPEAFRLMAALDACVIDTVTGGRPWRGPRLLLAERTAPNAVRVTCDSLDALVLEDEKDHGFALGPAGKGGAIASVTVADDDANAVVMTLEDADAMPLTVEYGIGRRGGLRDGFAESAPDGGTLHRWALPARLPVTPC